MADNKKYYYLKLKENFFDSDNMIILESMSDGYLYSNILLKLYLKGLKDNGRLMLNDVIPYNAQMLAKITRHQVGTVEKALDIFKQLGLIEVLDSGAIYMLNIQNYVGRSSTEGDRKRQARARIEAEKLAISDNSRQMSDKRPPEIEIEKEIEKEIEINTVCSESETAPSLSGIKISLNDKTFYDVPLDKIALWKETYPAVDIEYELRKMVAWCDSNPTKRKTKRGVERFINSWLAREQDRGGVRNNRQQATENAESDSYAVYHEMYKKLGPISPDDPFQ